MLSTHYLRVCINFQNDRHLQKWTWFSNIVILVYSSVVIHSHVLRGILLKIGSKYGQIVSFSLLRFVLQYYAPQHMLHVYSCIITDWYSTPFCSLISWISVPNCIRCSQAIFVYTILATLHILYIDTWILSDWFCISFCNLIK